MELVRKNYKSIAWALVLSMLATITPDMAFAFTDFTTGICKIVTAMTGSVGRTIATLAIVFLGIGAFFGKVNWGLAVMVTIGIIAIFGAAQIVNTLGGTGKC